MRGIIKSDEEVNFLDTEMTGNDLLNDRLVEICYQLDEAELVCERFHPPVPITVKALSIHHITNRMTIDWEELKTSKMKADLENVLTGRNLVAHNAAYDIAILSRDGVRSGDYICTLKVARYLDQDGVIPEYNLQYLRYFWELDVPNAFSHDAMSDVLVIKANFGKFYHLKQSL